MINPVADFLAMRQALLAKSRLISAWGFLLNVPPLIGGLIFIRTTEGQLVVAAILISLVIAGQIHRRMPLSRLIGLCHIVFLPVIPVLAGLVLGGPPVGLIFSGWVTYTLITMSICVILDVFDLYRYFVTGNRTYLD